MWSKISWLILSLKLLSQVTKHSFQVYVLFTYGKKGSGGCVWNSLCSADGADTRLLKCLLSNLCVGVELWVSKENTPVFGLHDGLSLPKPLSACQQSQMWGLVCLTYSSSFYNLSLSLCLGSKGQACSVLYCWYNCSSWQKDGPRRGDYRWRKRWCQREDLCSSECGGSCQHVPCTAGNHHV